MSCFKKIPCRYTIASLYIIDIFFGLFLCGIPQKYLITANLHTSVLRSTEMGSPSKLCKHMDGLHNVPPCIQRQCN